MRLSSCYEERKHHAFIVLPHFSSTWFSTTKQKQKACKNQRDSSGNNCVVLSTPWKFTLALLLRFTDWLKLEIWQFIGNRVYKKTGKPVFADIAHVDLKRRRCRITVQFDLFVPTNYWCRSPCQPARTWGNSTEGHSASFPHHVQPHRP